jgi:hypothetical protein
MAAVKIEESYNRAIAALDAALEEDDDESAILKESQSVTLSASLTKDATDGSIEADSTQKSQKVKPSTTSSKGQRQPFVIPPGSQQVDLTVSSDVEPNMPNKRRILSTARTTTMSRPTMMTPVCQRERAGSTRRRAGRAVCGRHFSRSECHSRQGRDGRDGRLLREMGDDGRSQMERRYLGG